MRQIPHPLRDFESLQHRPRRWVQTVAAYFLAWKFFPLEHDRPQAGQRAKCRARGPGRSAAYDSNIEDQHSLKGLMLPRLEQIFDPDGYWRMAIPAGLNRRQSAVLRELYLLREELAKERELPTV